MFDKKKLNFWRLAVLFTGMTITILFLLWSSPYKSKSAMMNSTMGTMMKSMHASNLSINGLLQNPSAQQQATSTEQHHENSPVYKIGILTSSIVFLLLPLLIGGSIILTIIWIK
jgi:hypothetical protein